MIRLNDYKRKVLQVNLEILRHNMTYNPYFRKLAKNILGYISKKKPGGYYYFDCNEKLVVKSILKRV